MFKNKIPKIIFALLVISMIATGCSGANQQPIDEGELSGDEGQIIDEGGLNDEEGQPIDDGGL